MVQCAHGDVVTYPLATVDLKVKGRALTVKAAVSDTLPQLVLLGTDVPDLSELLKAERQEKAHTIRDNYNFLEYLPKCQANLTLA